MSHVRIKNNIRTFVKKLDDGTIFVNQRPVNRSIFKVIPDLMNTGTWTLQLNGRVVRRTDTKREVVQEGARRAGSRGNAILEIRRTDGTVGEYRRYS